MFNQIIQQIYRGMFIVAGLIFIVAIWERILQFFNLTLSWISYEPWRLMEFSSIFLLFAIALLLRQIRDQLKQKS